MVKKLIGIALVGLLAGTAGWAVAADQLRDRDRIQDPTTHDGDEPDQDRDRDRTSSTVQTLDDQDRDQTQDQDRLRDGSCK